MNTCFYCGKGTEWGRSHTHHRGVAGGRWKKRAQKTNRTFKPNLQRVTIIVSSTSLRASTNRVQVKLCTKCIKRIKKDVLEGKKPFLTLAHVAVKPSLKDEAPVVAAVS